ncbi:DUF6902 family protein [Parasedimentitalea maritima]|uniref:Uncharacterized protein n=1 Tax=Parasedimentitalea maritima TaxID=2578117 RepID=A0A6A4REM6_9RHOB|nr:hypothetical protein [Zongyanglinia marina]KAE9626491.1 hypothetical protein GP644_20790 [Zongyanglinia marina]
MSNIIPLRAPLSQPPTAPQYGALIGNFAQYRRQQDDVFWLKENAELLNILECTGAKLCGDQFEPLVSFYSNIENRICFFQQYYRFILSICLDLEDLGFGGDKGEEIAHWVARQGLAEAELSDLQRAEARRLLLRRGVAGVANSMALTDRLYRFINRPETFALPNKKAAYELTHIVFYLSEYGRRDPGLGKQALLSLEYAGLLAFLDQNSDLLAEVCISLLYAGKHPPAAWLDWLRWQTAGFVITSATPGAGQDAYHDYFVCNWAMATVKGVPFIPQMAPGPMQIRKSAARIGPLRQMSQMLFDLGRDRSPSWPVMRQYLEPRLSKESYEILRTAESSSIHFESFFASFARSSLVFS